MGFENFGGFQCRLRQRSTLFVCEINLAPIIIVRETCSTLLADGVSIPGGDLFLVCLRPGVACLDQSKTLRHVRSTFTECRDEPPTLALGSPHPQGRSGPVSIVAIVTIRGTLPLHPYLGLLRSRGGRHDAGAPPLPFRSPGKGEHKR